MANHRKALVLYFHPAQKKSRVGGALSAAIRELPRVVFRDLYGLYPDFLIDVHKEQQLLEEHDLIIFQHPIYWYSCPPLLKLWIDEVFEHGWAYGEGGTKLQGKMLLSVVSAGGSAQAYSANGSNRFEMKTFLSPFNQTAHVCGMKYMEPLVVHGARGLSERQISDACHNYVQLLSTYFETGELP